MGTTDPARLTHLGSRLCTAAVVILLICAGSPQARPRASSVHLTCRMLGYALQHDADEEAPEFDGRFAGLGKQEVN
jgi:hypothetical protein